MSLGLCQGGLTFSSKLWFIAITHKCGVWQQHGAMSPNYARHRREADERSCGSTTEEKRYGTGLEDAQHLKRHQPLASLRTSHLPNHRVKQLISSIFSLCLKRMSSLNCAPGWKLFPAVTGQRNWPLYLEHVLSLAWKPTALQPSH